MAEKARRHSLVFRPHFKTHQLHEVGRWFRDAGVTKITTSSLDMASYFASDGWDDITVAFPVNALEMETINNLAKKITLNLLVESTESVRKISEGLEHPINLFIKVDVGTSRTGLLPENQEEIRTIVSVMENARHMTWSGFLAHAGHSYNCHGREEILDVHSNSMDLLSTLKHDFSDYPDTVISFGDTPTCSMADSFPPIDELRPGNFTFYDLMQLEIGSCTQDKIAVAMACPVVAKHPDRNELIIYGGCVHFSKEKKEHYGCVVYEAGDGWGSIYEGTLVKLSQEHGTISAPKEWIEKTNIGDIIKILPIHSCLTMDLMRHFSWEII